MPVITTAENGAAELIREGENGYIQQNPLDPGELSRCIGKCLDRKVLKIMGSVAWKTSLPFTREKNMQETIGVFSQLLNEKQG
jgi:glycosyltransferase involved in cell wall biosynthesis